MDQLLQIRVEDEFDWDPLVEASHIGVSVHDGAVTLSGHVSTFAERRFAVAAAKRVIGVKALADEIRVHATNAHRKDDTDIATRVAHVLSWNVNLPDGAVQARVANGDVTLTGTVDWDAQRHHIEKQVEHVGGVRNITNSIKVKPTSIAENVKDGISKAFGRNAALDAADIEIDVKGRAVVLRGSVRTLNQRDIAHRIAWAAPGVEAVTDRIYVR